MNQALLPDESEKVLETRLKNIGDNIVLLMKYYTTVSNELKKIEDRMYEVREMNILEMGCLDEVMEDAEKKLNAVSDRVYALEQKLGEMK